MPSSTSSCSAFRNYTVTQILLLYNVSGPVAGVGPLPAGLLEANGPQGIPPAVEWASGGVARMSKPRAGRGVPPDAATPGTSLLTRGGVVSDVSPFIARTVGPDVRILEYTCETAAYKQ